MKIFGHRRRRRCLETGLMRILFYIRRCVIEHRKTAWSRSLGLRLCGSRGGKARSLHVTIANPRGTFTRRYFLYLPLLLGVLRWEGKTRSIRGPPRKRNLYGRYWKTAFRCSPVLMKIYSSVLQQKCMTMDFFFFFFCGFTRATDSAAKTEMYLLSARRPRGSTF